ncbi:hypothetical protein GCM10018963_62810 [Saccharothrix longispora]
MVTAPNDWLLVTQYWARLDVPLYSRHAMACTHGIHMLSIELHAEHVIGAAWAEVAGTTSAAAATAAPTTSRVRRDMRMGSSCVTFRRVLRRDVEDTTRPLRGRGPLPAHSDPGSGPKWTGSAGTGRLWPWHRDVAGRRITWRGEGPHHEGNERGTR